MLFIKSDYHLKFNALSNCIYTHKSDHRTDHINRQSADSFQIRLYSPDYAHAYITNYEPIIILTIIKRLRLY